MGQMRLISLVGLTISLFVLGVIGLLRIGTYGLKTKVQEQFSVTAIVPSTFTKEQEQSLQALLEQRREVASVRYISKEEAAQEIAESMGQSVEEMLAPLGGNPFDAVYELHIAASYVHRDSLDRLEQALQAEGLELGLNYKVDLLETLVRNMRLLEWISWAILLFLALLTYIQMANTIRMFIYADRLSIRILTLVGARPWFVRAPFVWRAVLDGILSVIFALLALAAVVCVLEYWGSLPILSVLDPEHLFIAVGCMLTVAVSSTALSAWLSTQRYIRMRSGLIHLD